MRHYNQRELEREFETETNWIGAREEDIAEESVDDLEIEWGGLSHSGMHPKKGKTSNARRYIEEYWENKRMREIQKDVFDLE